jgi:hypothetical protein
MVTVTDFVVRLGESVVELIVVFLRDVALADPLSFVLFLLGGLFVTASVGAFGVLALGALARELGGPSTTGGRQVESSPRH